MSKFLYSYNEQSEAARQLALALEIKRIKHENSQFIGSPTKTVINWGATKVPGEVARCKVLNNPPVVFLSSNKLSFFQSMSIPNGPRIPPFTTSIDMVMSWLSEGYSVCIRRILNGHSADGLSIISPGLIDNLVIAPLYTKYIKKKDEYRIHFAFNRIIDIQKKVLRKQDDEGNDIDPRQVNFKIRNHQNGFIFIRNGFNVPEDVKRQAEIVLNFTELDFGAIDIIFNYTEQQAYVLEVNTAPGLCGQTVQSYATAFKEYFDAGSS